jgi:hypothetical protein
MKRMIVAVLFFVIFGGVLFAQQTVMTVKYKEGKKIIKHPSGVISEYNKADLERHRAELVGQRDRLNEQIALIDKEMIDVAATLNK